MTEIAGWVSPKYAARTIHWVTCHPMNTEGSMKLIIILLI